MEITATGRKAAAVLIRAWRAGLPPVTRADKLCLILWKGGGMRRGATVYQMVEACGGYGAGTPIIVDVDGRVRFWDQTQGWHERDQAVLTVDTVGRPA